MVGGRYGGGTVLPWGGRGVAIGKHRDGSEGRGKEQGNKEQGTRSMSEEW